MILANEFAQVEVMLDEAGNGPRLRVVDLKTGKSGYLDPLELESLAWATKDELVPLMDPAASRWRSISREDLDDLASTEQGLADTPHGNRSR